MRKTNHPKVAIPIPTPKKSMMTPRKMNLTTFNRLSAEKATEKEKEEMIIK